MSRKNDTNFCPEDSTALLATVGTGIETMDYSAFYPQIIDDYTYSDLLPHRVHPIGRLLQPLVEDRRLLPCYFSFSFQTAGLDWVSCSSPFWIEIMVDVVHTVCISRDEK